MAVYKGGKGGNANVWTNEEFLFGTRRKLQSLDFPRVQFSSIANSLRICIWGCVVASEPGVGKA